MKWIRKSRKNFSPQNKKTPKQYLCMTWINIGYRNNGRHKPLVWSPTIEIGPCEFDRARIFIGTSRSMECKRFIRVVCVSYLYLICRFRVVPVFNIVWQPASIPLIYSIKFAGVIFRQWFRWNCTQITYFECVHCWNFLQMNWIIEVVQSECAWRKSWECLIEEAAIRRCVRTVWWKVYSRGIDKRIGRYISHRWQEIIHHTRIVGIVDCGPNKTALQNVTPEEWSTQCHVVEMQ